MYKIATILEDKHDYLDRVNFVLLIYRYMYTHLIGCNCKLQLCQIHAFTLNVLLVVSNSFIFWTP